MAPIPAEAWAEIDEQGVRSLTEILSARKAIDVTGPMGTVFPGVPEGRLEFPKKQPKDFILKIIPGFTYHIPMKFLLHFYLNLA